MIKQGANMTCDRNCSWCIYGYRQVEKYKCGNKNVTCDGECHKCPFRKEEFVKYICNVYKRNQKGNLNVYNSLP